MAGKDLRPHSDGTMVWMDETDRAAEDRIIDTLSKAWKCSVHRFSRMHCIDFYAVRHDRIMATIEMKTRHIPHDKYPEVWLSWDKYVPLMNYYAHFRASPVFLVEFTDGLWWIDARDINATHSRFVACHDPRTPPEPVILVPVCDMKPLTEGVR